MFSIVATGSSAWIEVRRSSGQFVSAVWKKYGTTLLLPTLDMGCRLFWALMIQRH
jgi:hypothetical protein